MERKQITPWFYYDVYDKGKRTVYAPSAELKKVQRFILRHYFKEVRVSKSVRECASLHCGKKWLMKLDIKDFFNSITEEQIKNVIKEYAGSNDAEYVFKMCTLDEKLPTGAPTSPCIANLVLSEFDSNIEKVCKRLGVSYSRYMDDLFFSTDGKQYLLSLVELRVLEEFKYLGFEVNVDKIKYISGNKCQKVLGLGVNNDEPVLTKEDKRRYRAYFYNLINPICYSKTKKYIAKESEILGHLAYIKSVDEVYYNRICRYIFNLINKWELRDTPCLKRLIRINNL